MFAPPPVLPFLPPVHPDARIVQPPDVAAQPLPLPTAVAGVGTGSGPALRARLADAPDDAEAWTAHAILLYGDGNHTAAECGHRRALRIRPDHEGVWSNLSFVLSQRSRHDEAIAAVCRSLALAPANGGALFNLTTALYRRGDFDQDRVVLDRLLRLEPGVPSRLWGRGQIRLHEGDYEGGFADYEARYGLSEYHYRLHRGPRWNGEPLDDKIVMVTTEQGFGDTLLMARYLPLLKGRGARRVVVECAPELRRLFAGLLEGPQGIDAFIPRDAAPTPIYHLHSSIMSLPLRFGTTIGSVPPPVRLTIPEEARAKAAGLVPRSDRLKVGIVWSGNQLFPDNAIRAAGLDRFLPLLEVPGVVFYSLQKGPPEEALRHLPPGTPITALGPALEDFADTAAVLERLDLVVMTDSSVAHLAGSLGVPVWNLVQHVPYWVYRRTGTTTPWYPSMRLYRQGADEDWTPVFDAVRRDLTALAGSGAAART